MKRYPSDAGANDGADAAPAEPVHLRFDRDSHPDPIARARAWQAAMSVSMETVFAPDELDGFAGSASIRPLGQLVLCDIAASAGTALRHRSTRAKWEHDHVILDLLVAGTLRGVIGATPVSLGPGDCFMVDLRGGMRVRFDGTRFVGLIIPRAVFDAHAGGHRAVDGLLFAAATPQAQVLGPLLTALNAQAPSLPSPVAQALAQALAAVAAACAVPGDAPRLYAPPDRPSKPSATLARLRRAIERQAARPEFGIETLCTQFGLSRTALYRLFEPAGGVAEAIRRRRAAVAVRLLTRPGGGGLKMAEVARASGFGNERSLRNALREYHDASPGEIMRNGTETSVPREPPAADIGRLFDGL